MYSKLIGNLLVILQIDHHRCDGLVNIEQNTLSVICMGPPFNGEEVLVMNIVTTRTEEVLSQHLGVGRSWGGQRKPAWIG